MQAVAAAPCRAVSCRSGQPTASGWGRQRTRLRLRPCRRRRLVLRGLRPAAAKGPPADWRHRGQPSGPVHGAPARVSADDLARGALTDARPHAWWSQRHPATAHVSRCAMCCARSRSASSVASPALAAVAATMASFALSLLLQWFYQQVRLVLVASGYFTSFLGGCGASICTH